MSGATTELNLRTAVDADDTADYLTLDLANSLRTVDALFNNVTGHNHQSSHQGGPLTIGTGNIADGSITSPKIADGSIQTVDLADGSVTSAKLAPPIDIAGYFRSTNVPIFPTSGVGLELYYSPGAGGIMQVYDRSGSVYAPALVIGSTVSLHVGGLAGLTVNADGSVTTAGVINVGGDAINMAAGIVIVGDGNNLFYRCTAGGGHLFQHTDGSLATVSCGAINTAGITASGLITANAGINAAGTSNINVLNVTSMNFVNGGTMDGGGSGYIRASSLTVTPGPFAAAATTINGALTVNGGSQMNGHVAMSGDLYVADGVTGITIALPGGNYGTYNKSTRSGTSAGEVAVGNYLYVPGDIYAGLRMYAISFNQTSDPRLKAGMMVVPDVDCMARVRNPGLAVQTYSMPLPPTGDEVVEPAPTSQEIGFDATQMAVVNPEMVSHDAEGAPISIGYANLTAILWGALRELDARVQILEAA